MFIHEVIPEISSKGLLEELGIVFVIPNEVIFPTQINSIYTTGRQGSDLQYFQEIAIFDSRKDFHFETWKSVMQSFLGCHL